MNQSTNSIQYDVSLLTDQDLYLFNEGTHSRMYQKMGAHQADVNGAKGIYFAVWAPNAEHVTVLGDFNGWHDWTHHLRARGQSGIWEGFIPGVMKGMKYKFKIFSRHNGYSVLKTDPYGIYHEEPPRTASVIWDLDYKWEDGDWMKERRKHNAHDAPISIYEVHLGSWRRVPDEWNRPLTYRELAEQLPEYVSYMGYTHVEFLPVMEHPLYRSWGYQTTGYFAPTSRYGTPQDFMHLIDRLHQRGIGVILDWVPSHFPSDQHGLSYFDGTHIYEHADPKLGFHPDWASSIFNYGRHEVRSFLLSSALYWFDVYHIDGLRLDAVASMLYLDYSRKEGEWIPNIYGGRENLDAISFLRRLNEEIYKNYPDVQTYAEESTAWPMVSRPTYVGGLGFGFKWDMGWMHDTLVYVSHDPVHRKFHQQDLTFRMLYAFTENFVLPLSHDEVVHGKGSLIGKLPGDDWQKFAGMRLLYGYMFTQPGKQLLFMGCEFGQWGEWDHDQSLDWHLLDYDLHRGLLHWVRDLNRLYRDTPALYEVDGHSPGYEWVDCNDSDQSVITYMRWGKDRRSAVLAVCNFTPMPRHHYKVGAAFPGFWREIINSDAQMYGGGNFGNFGGVWAQNEWWHGKPHTLYITLPPLSIVVLEGRA
ncbi:MAG: 1,4-alpha-glucan branching protein GlgB [Elusimicrobia bacterium]|nr:1,4-alpha-glucan branching protein GlgB [Candidatus Obscuribacterium magneticum]